MSAARVTIELLSYGARFRPPVKCAFSYFKKVKTYLGDQPNIYMLWDFELFLIEDYPIYGAKHLEMLRLKISSHFSRTSLGYWQLEEYTTVHSLLPFVYSRTYLERPPHWPQKCGLSRQVVSGDRFNYIEM